MKKNISNLQLSISKRLNKWLSYSLFVMAILVSQQMYAYDFEVNGIGYNYSTDSSMVEVTSMVEVIHGGYKDKKYKGAIVIPDVVNYNGQTLKVIAIDTEAFKFHHNLMERLRSAILQTLSTTILVVKIQTNNFCPIRSSDVPKIHVRTSFFHGFQISIIQREC